MKGQENKDEEALADAEMKDIRDWAVLLTIWVFFFLIVPHWLALIN